MSRRTGIVNVRMVITEEKILSNIDKVQKLINPKSKKQIVQLEDDTYFKDLVESIKTYLIEYPKKKNFPVSVYKAAYGLVEYATNQFEENTKQIEELIRQREENITLSGELKELIETVDNKEKGWKDKVKNAEDKFSEDIIETLNIVGKSKGKKSENYLNAMKLLKARATNLESNLHIEIDMERIEDKSKALSYIGIEIADALKEIPTPVEKKVEEATPVVAVETKKTEKRKAEKKKAEKKETVQVIEETTPTEQQEYVQSVTFEKKPSLWQRFKETKLVRTIRYIMKVRIVLEYPALPEGENPEHTYATK